MGHLLYTGADFNHSVRTWCYAFEKWNEARDTQIRTKIIEIRIEGVFTKSKNSTNRNSCRGHSVAPGCLQFVCVQRNETHCMSRCTLG